MSRERMGEVHSLSHKALERAVPSACISAKLMGVGVRQSLAPIPLERSPRFPSINRNKKGKNSDE
ncbi:hypothetical protein SAMN05216404_101226 [Nitrosospira multiformis]|uniref:Uncharacterized protein n=1 Tax=Nitrosospira multiformis TaxID=1231 RepID=A0A1H8BH86_9PROT|nr:hypothetical protein SAMN05216404_101226 [Nitrosospira multiformis]